MNDNKLLVGIDLDIGLKLYTVPKNELKRLKKNFSNINFQFMNTKKNPKIIKDIDIYWGNRIDKKIISECKNLKWIHFGSVGVDRARTRDIFDRKILVTNSSEIMDRAIVESIIQFITNFARGYFLCQDLRNKNNLSRETFDKYFDQIKNLEDQTCLIVGFGSIGIGILLNTINYRFRENMRLLNKIIRKR